MSIKKAFTLLFFIIFTAISVKAQTGWVKQQLDDRVAVKFPATPKMSVKASNTAYRDTDRNNLIYSAGVVDFMVVAHLDSASLAAMKDSQQFADGIKKGLTGTTKSYELGDVILGTWKDHTSYSITGTSAEKKTKIYMLIIIIGSKGYFFSTVVPDAASPKNKDDYFASIELSH